MNQFRIQTSSPDNPEIRNILGGIFQHALIAADPQEAVSRYLRHQEASLFQPGHVEGGKLVLISLGKAARAMAAAACNILGEQVHSGIVVEKNTDNSIHLPDTIAVLQGGHPIPNVCSQEAGGRIAELVRTSAPDAEFLVLISGGGSSLVTLLPEGIDIADYQALNRLMLGSHLSIAQINTIRKHVDLFKGGGLLRLIGERSSRSLILSDVVSGGLGTVASGPTLPDGTTFGMAVDILRQSGIWNGLPESITAHLRAGTAGELLETLKPDDPLCKFSRAVEVGSLKQSLTAAVDAAKELGWNASICEPALTGRVEDAAHRILRDLAEGYHRGEKQVWIYGGETTVNPGNASGRGGRNSHLALLLSRELVRFPGVVVCTFATDGEDGNSSACGSVVTPDTFPRAAEHGMDPADYLNRFDSHTFFHKLGDTIEIGSTGTNVNDITVVLKN